VAPDHARMKAVTRVLAQPFARDCVRFLGNVEVGRDLSHDELTACYDAVVYASGTEHDRRLGVPGEDLPGAVGASRFVRWYNGHPDAAVDEFPLDAEQVAVVGAGNVALDVARVLARTADELRDTDVPARVLAALERSAVRDIHVLIRRGTAEARFTPAELFQLSELADADVLVHDGGEGIPDPAEAEDRRVRQNLETFRAFADTVPAGRRRRIHLRFLTSPVAILGEDRVRAMEVEHNLRADDGTVRGNGQRTILDVGSVVSAVGFRGAPLPGLPFDEETGTVPNRAGRVLSGDSSPAGVYVAGWLKRGPTGSIGTNKPDGAETARAVLEDLPATTSSREDVLDLLQRRQVRTVDWAGWLSLEKHEAALGRAEGRGRVKVHDLDSMLEHCAAVAAAE
jgi:ferredoxin--NADP+ reductase